MPNLHLHHPAENYVKGRVPNVLGPGLSKRNKLEDYSGDQGSTPLFRKACGHTDT